MDNKCADPWMNYYADRVSVSSDLYWQVGKTVNGKPIDETHLILIANQIEMILGIDAGDMVLDIGCGNGLLTKIISNKAMNIFGVERNSMLFKSAILNSAEKNISYINSNIESFDIKQTMCNKAYMYEVLQHFKYEYVLEILTKIITGLKDNGKLFIGGIPDEEKKWSFYNTPERRKRLLSSLMNGKDPIGVWYHKDYLVTIGNSIGVKVKIIAQDKDLYTSHYRFDCLFDATY